MADVAQIGIIFDTSQVKDGIAVLNQISPAAASASQATQQLSTATSNAATAAAKGTSANNSLRTSMVAEASAASTATTAVRALATANDNLSTTAKAASGSMSILGVQSYQIRNIAQQLSQVSQQGQVTGNFLGALAIQLPDVTAAFGPLGIAAGVAAGLLLQYFTTAGDGGERAAKVLEDQQNQIRAVADAWGDAVPALQAYVDELDRAKSVTDLKAATAAVNADTLKPLIDQITDARTQMGGLTQDLQQAGYEDSSILNLQSAFQAFSVAALAGKDATQQAADVNTQLNAAIEATGIPALMDFGTAFDALAQRATVAAGAVAAATAQMTAQLNTAGRVQSELQNSIQSGANPANFYDRTTPTNVAIGGNGSFVPIPTPDARPSQESFAVPKAKGGGRGKGGRSKTELESITQGLQDLNAPVTQAEAAVKALETAFKDGTIDGTKYGDTMKQIGTAFEASGGTAQQWATVQLSAVKDAVKDGLLTNQQYADTLKQIHDQFIATGGSSDQWAIVMAGNTKKVSDGMKDVNTDVKSFVNTFASGLEQGKSLMESFTDAIKSLADKLINQSLNAIVDVLFPTKSSGATGAATGGGLFGGISKLFSGLFSAKGNAFDGAGVSAFANGGAFTNSIVSSPTMFAFANGGALGVMGEAGPEAVMPLKRGSDGSLGVQLHSANAGAKSAPQNTVSVSNVFKLEGVVSEAAVTARIQQSAQQTLDQTKKSMVGWLNDYSRDGAFS